MPCELKVLERTLVDSWCLGMFHKPIVEDNTQRSRHATREQSITDKCFSDNEAKCGTEDSTSSGHLWKASLSTSFRSWLRTAGVTLQNRCTDRVNCTINIFYRCLPNPNYCDKHIHSTFCFLRNEQNQQLQSLLSAASSRENSLLWLLFPFTSPSVWNTYIYYPCGRLEAGS